MPEFVIQEFPENHRLKRFTFTVDGIPSLYWCPTRHAVERVVTRLKLGRSGEAFGGAGVTTGGVRVGYASPSGEDKKARAKVMEGDEIVTEIVTMKSGTTKPREKRQGYIFELDKKIYEGTASEQETKTLCAVAAFMTRGRMGVNEEAQAAFKDLTGMDCKIHMFAAKLVAKDQDGGLWFVGVNLNAPLTRKYTFKPIFGEFQSKVQANLGCELGGLKLKEKT